MERNFYLVLLITSLFFIPISSTLLHSNIGQFTDVKKYHTHGRDDSTSSNISITEIGAFKFGTQPNSYNEMPILYLMETFHFEGNLSLSNGQPLGGKCLKIYLDEGTVDGIPITTVLSNNSSGNFQWYSGDPLQNPTLRGVEIPGMLEGIYSFSVAYEPNRDLSNYGGCDSDSDSSSNGSYFEIAILVRSRVSMETVLIHDEYAENELVRVEVLLLRERPSAAIENEEVLLLRQYFSNESQWITEGEINSTTKSNGIALFEWQFKGKNCGDQTCQGLWRIIVYYPGSMFFAPTENLTHEMQYKKTEESNNGTADSNEITWSKMMGIVEISALLISLISLMMYMFIRKKGNSSDLDELADKIISRQNSSEITKHNIENTDMEKSEITQKQTQLPKLETHDSDSKQDLADPENNVKIVQNITYNIQDSSVVGDLNTVKNSDLE